MQPAYEVPEFSVSRSKPSEIEVDLLAIPVFQDERAVLEVVDKAANGEVSAAFERGEFAGKSCELMLTAPEKWRTRRVLLVGAGPRSEFNAERARRVGASVTIAGRQQRRGRVAIAVPEGCADVESLVEGATLGNYDNGHYKSKPEARFFVSRVDVIADGDVGSAIERGRRVGESTNAARVLINEPGNRLSPREFAARAQALLAIGHVSSEVLDEHRLEQLGMGLLLGVARGSEEPPRLIVGRYEPPNAPKTPVLALVGKGVTFDTGGISIKPSDGMERMKDDMAGGAAVICALRSIALEQLPVRVMAVVPATENMPSGAATKPGDVHRGASGVTVEINNTDAEGRLILGDALWYAQQQGATHLIDVATLTGACIVALGKITTGLFATAGWDQVVLSAATRAGEKMWPMPLFEEYRESLKSEIADLLNSPGRPAGAITAAMFLKEFVDTTPWAHLDIAGTAWAEEARPWMVKGATGVMVRTLVEVARTAGKGWPAAS
jgi:leucyl aminopeptidase